MRTRRRRRALPWKRRFSSFSSSVSSSRAALRILASVYFTRQTSRLFRRPYWPMILNSASRRGFSKGRRGVT
uniref:Putative secreted protein n=1 Tax=Anopheles darlingi TaxID=43151 RepID=A0A2M4DEW3_ANODA